MNEKNFSQELIDKKNDDNMYCTIIWKKKNYIQD